MVDRYIKDISSMIRVSITFINSGPTWKLQVVKKLEFPRYIDFGQVELNRTVQRTIPLENDVPVEFSFRIETLEADPAFEIDPIEGIIPPNGKTHVVIKFRPYTYKISRLELEVTCSQFNFSPIRCTATGTSQPGLTQERMEQRQLEKTIEEESQVLNKLDDSLFSFSKMVSETGTVNALAKSRRPPPTGKPEGRPSVTELREQLNEQRRMIDKKLRQLKYGRSAGAVADPGLTLLAQRFQTFRENYNRKEQEWWETTKKAYETGNLSLLDLSEEERYISRERGLRIPEDLSTVSATNFVLSQNPDHFTIKDLRIATEQQKALKRQQQETQKKIREQYTSGEPSKHALLRGVYSIPAVLIDVRANHLISRLWTQRKKYQQPSSQSGMQETGSLDVEFDSDKLLEEVLSRRDEELHVLDKAMDEHLGLCTHSATASSSLGDPMKLRRLVFSNETEDLARAEQDRIYASKDEWLGDDPPSQSERRLINEEQHKLNQLEAVLRCRALRRVRKPLRQSSNVTTDALDPSLPQDREVQGLPSWEGSGMYSESKARDSTDAADLVWSVRKNSLRRLRQIFSVGLIRLRTQRRLSYLSEIVNSEKSAKEETGPPLSSVLYSTDGKLFGKDIRLSFARIVFPRSSVSDDAEFQTLSNDAKDRLGKIRSLAQNASIIAARKGLDQSLAKKAVLIGISPTGTLPAIDDYEQQEIENTLRKNKPREAIPQYGIRAVRSGKGGHISSLDVTLEAAQGESSEEYSLERLISSRWGLMKSSEAFHPYIGTKMADFDFCEPATFDSPPMTRAEADGVSTVPLPACSDYPPLETMRSLRSGALEEDPIGCGGSQGVPVSGWNQTFTKEWLQAAEDERVIRDEEGKRRKKELRQSMSKLSKETGMRLFTEEESEKPDGSTEESDEILSKLPLFPFRVRPPFAMREVDMTHDESLHKLAYLVGLKVDSHQMFWRRAASLLGPGFLDPGCSLCENFSLKGLPTVNERHEPYAVSILRYLISQQSPQQEGVAQERPSSGKGGKKKDKKDKPRESATEVSVAPDNDFFKSMIGYEPCKFDTDSLPILFENLKRQPVIEVDPRRLYDFDSLICRYIRFQSQSHPDDKLIAAATGIAPASFTFSGIGDFDYEGVKTPNENAHKFWKDYLSTRDLLESDICGVGIGSSLPGYTGISKIKKEDTVLDFLLKAVDMKKREHAGVHFSDKDQVVALPPTSLQFQRPQVYSLAKTISPSLTSFVPKQALEEGKDVTVTENNLNETDKRRTAIASYMEKEFSRNFDNDQLTYDLNGEVRTELDEFGGSVGYHSFYMSFHDEPCSESDFVTDYDPFSGIDFSERYGALGLGEHGFADNVELLSHSATEDETPSEAVGTELEIESSYKLFGLVSSEEQTGQSGSKGKKGKSAESKKSPAKDKRGKKDTTETPPEDTSTEESFISKVFKAFPHLSRAAKPSPLYADTTTTSTEEGKADDEAVSDSIVLKREQSVADSETNVDSARHKVPGLYDWLDRRSNGEDTSYSVHDKRFTYSYLPHILLEPAPEDQLSDDSESDTEGPDKDAALCRAGATKRTVTIFDLENEFGKYSFLVSPAPEQESTEDTAEESHRSSSSKRSKRKSTTEKNDKKKGQETQEEDDTAESTKAEPSVEANSRSNDKMKDFLEWNCRKSVEEIQKCIRTQHKNNIVTNGILNPSIFDQHTQAEPSTSQKVRILLNMRAHARLRDSMTTLGLSLASFNAVLKQDTTSLQAVYEGYDWLRCRWDLPVKFSNTDDKFKQGETDVHDKKMVDAYEARLEHLVTLDLNSFKSRAKGGMGKVAMYLLPCPQTIVEVEGRRAELERRKRNLQAGRFQKLD